MTEADDGARLVAPADRSGRPEVGTLVAMGRGATRVAVVQLDCHPAAVLPGSRDPLEDPLFEGDDETLPTPGAVAEALAEPVRALRTRVRKAYCGQLLSKVAAILEACRGWGVQMVVFPEYSIPWQILDGVAAASGDVPRSPRPVRSGPARFHRRTGAHHGSRQAAGGWFSYQSKKS